MFDMKRLIAIACIFFLLPFEAFGEDNAGENPHWSLDVKAGLFYPAIEHWQEYYGGRSTGNYTVGIAYKIVRRIEAGIEGGFIRDAGKGYAPGHGMLTGRVVYELFPLNAYILLRGEFTKDQWIVPYVGGGWTKIYYREETEFQETRRGHSDGMHARAGLQFLLDGLDRSAANSLYLDYGVHHTYLIIEVQRLRALINTTGGDELNIGGTSFLAGLLFEY